MKRKYFLKSFLGALGAKKIEWLHESNSNISGRVIYELDDPEEVQEFIWNISERETPSEDVRALAELIHDKELLSIDKIKISRSELRREFSLKQARIISEYDFMETLNSLKSVQVRMADEGRETDVYFIHE